MPVPHADTAAPSAAVPPLIFHPLVHYLTFNSRHAIKTRTTAALHGNTPFAFPSALFQ